jgi:N-methylhydantoinase A
MRPVVGKYVRNLKAELTRMGMNGQLSLLRSDGGLMSAQAAELKPVNLLMSGPAGGVTGAIFVAKNAGFKNILTLDVGGTSTDVALIEHGEPRLQRTTEVAHLSVRASSLDVRTVGAGGGSIAHVPELTKALRVGPQSAGAMPGPACYGRGGTEATVSDANLVLGYLPEELLGGRMKLDKAAAIAAVQKVADAMGVDLMEAARGIIDIVNENMFGALRMISVQQGYDPREFALMGFGGAGSLHSNAVAKLMGSWPVIVPISPGVLCAAGDATTRSRAETARSFSKRKSQTTNSDVHATLSEMADQAKATLIADGISEADISLKFEIDVRYYGQGFEVPMAVELDDFVAGGVEKLASAFDEEHRRLFTFNMETEHELVNLRCVALGKALELPVAPIEQGTGDASAARLTDHKMWVEGGWQDGAIYDRAKLRAGDVLSGPAIITEMDSTALVLPGCVAKVDALGNILINPA